MNCGRTEAKRRHRRGAVAVFVVTSLTMLLGFTALTIDMGYLYSVQAELQAVADAAALAGASQLARGTPGEGPLLARDAAVRYAALNDVDNNSLVIDPAVDIEYGAAEVDLNTGKFSFVPPQGRPTALRVTARKTANSPNGAVNLFFAQVFGHARKDLWAKATAVIIPRDIALTIDLSGSMNDDSELAYIDKTRINTFEVWEDLGSPTFGAMNTWGVSLEQALAGYWNQMDDLGWPTSHPPRPYDPRHDPGLLYISSGTTTQIKTTLGLTSVPYPYADGSWTEYVNYVKSSSSVMADAGFRHCYGLKTFVSFLLEEKERHAETPELAQTRAQPIYAVKQAAEEFIRVVDALDSADRVSLEVYAQTTRHEVDLTEDFQAVLDRFDELQAGHYDSYTNTGGGLRLAIDELTGERARPYAVKVIVLLSDGIANIDEDGSYDLSGARAYALQEARAAAAAGIRIYTISVGSQADRGLLQEIANAGKGSEFFAAGSVDEYSAQLRQIFATVGGKRLAALVQ